MRCIILLLVVLLAGCTTAAGIQPIGTVDIASKPLPKFTHADLLNAASIASKNGFQGRADFWTANDHMLTECENAISAAIPKLPAAGQTVGAATLIELGAEAVGTAGIPANVKIKCEPIVLPSGLFPVLLR